jgi:hypothetical protein
MRLKSSPFVRGASRIADWSRIEHRCDRDVNVVGWFAK